VEAPANRPGCSFRTQQGANHPSQPHQPHLSAKRSKPLVYSASRPLPIRTRQCLRL